MRSGREIVRRIRGHARYVSPELAQHIDATSTVEQIIRAGHSGRSQSSGRP
ncbi:hypothetical protein BZL29_8442 [Mycobacterium kansasii]|uniref:Uncharacterized protein n=1 Tax=Mycobacterium kansasii TaxID=1768 RepID=A0A1V3W9W1_MYCKA|nr:hypothetical protein BZL29_8442 [Mycobacterium kansasii]